MVVYGRHLHLEFYATFLFAMTLVGILVAPPNRIRSCTLLTDATGHTIIMLNIMIDKSFEKPGIVISNGKRTEWSTSYSWSNRASDFKCLKLRGRLPLSCMTQSPISNIIVSITKCEKLRNEIFNVWSGVLLRYFNTVF